MKTQFETKKEYADILKKIAKEISSIEKVKPVNFMKVMKENRGFIHLFSPYGITEDTLERKNPLIVALGDSVTAGHFEFHGDMREFFSNLDKKGVKEDEIIEIIDVKESYLEKFHGMLINQYEQTAVSAINSGIAGDNMYGMQKRLYRDVIRYQPDLVLINGALNWDEQCGDNASYQKVLQEVVEEIKEKTFADIILITPNMELPGLFVNSKSTLLERVQIIRKIAEQEKVCLADVYKVWQEYNDMGHPIKELLANGVNHPSIVGHEVYAIVLMKLINSL